MVRAHGSKAHSPTMKAPFWLLSLAIPAIPCGAGPFDPLSANERVTAVSASAFNGYVRARAPDGTYKPETFAFGNGGILGVLTMKDTSFDAMDFIGIAHVLAVPLAEQNYVRSLDPKTTNLLLMVFWGTTFGGVNTKSGYVQDELDFANAKLLGFDSEEPFRDMTDPTADPSAAFWGPSFRQILLHKTQGAVVSAIEVNRYFVILRAFDFQSAWKRKKMKLLWETRFSLSQRWHEFDKDLPRMAQSAALYFGQDSYGLVLRPVPEGRVNIGEPRVLEAVATDDGARGDVSVIAGEWRGKSHNVAPFDIHVEAGGKSTFESRAAGFVVPADVSIRGSEVTIEVKGWGTVFRGTLAGDRIEGTLFQYGQVHAVTLNRDSVANPGQRSDTRGSPSN
jgi:hypothetical protein